MAQVGQTGFDARLQAASLVDHGKRLKCLFFPLSNADDHAPAAVTVELPGNDPV